ncbi:DUF2785 domain-containing protein [Clostridium sp. D2Q-11]|uniref:DUF2785 domain-containing protein n=1 Tax=Anaeromonas frigoriresistens TaxID=2683708 RepID=A0A942Z8X7_9FIRM|nr:DUF2785 domain-containing protein [Anaeromonas frigoriresistens]MBS4538479.1 DUF2785 domain-containing protein [Anaeromonas frigoriresistens]
MEKQELKKLLRSIKENEYVVPKEVNPYELSLLMMDYIGDTDMELRDRLILSNLSTWIMNGVLSHNEVFDIMMIAIDENHLLKGLGMVNDSVFSRTFSVEVVGSAIYRHRKENFLSKSDIEKAFDAVLKSYNEDIDVRGYIEDKGWAHGAAHGADALDEFARCEEIGYKGLKRILDAIYKKVNINNYGYIHFEDERMITPIKAIVERGIIPTEKIEEWIRSFKNIEKIDKYPEDLVIQMNVNIFLKSLYFRLIDKSEYENITNTTKEVLQEISLFKNY